MHHLRTLIAVVDRIRDTIGIALLAGMNLLIGLQVVFRYVLNDPLTWPEEIARNSFVWMTALGVAKLYRERSNWLIDYFLLKTPSSVQRAAGIVYDVAGLFFFIVLVIGAWPVLVANAHIKTATGLYMNVLYGSFAVAGLLCIPALLDSLAHRLGWSGSGPPQPPSNRPLGGAMS